ncbi:PREDICTED: uncharacterized protein LOC109474514 [Branchiostoma belcheri]|uniref:Uncharacterized protein LOC109474514 n=1 Tax=Branchiostoma belcheri TaxID=7741 RepID=A0A6P4ZL73_BRABE|nr:PREDICTED: uncharacterized protein LOC109474514 [Branchiostoma belcheri]
MSDASTVAQEDNTAQDLGASANPGETQPHASTSGQSRSSGELDFHSPAESEEDDTDSDGSSNNGHGRAAVGIAPPLGQHEKYHVFFCYSSADAPWVKDTIQKLESDELGFMCCFHERDFLPGVAIIDNIVRSIHESQKTVFVLSRDFVESRWCNFERQVVMGANLREENKKVIPVMLRECDLPEFLQHMTYLEVWTAYFFDRFIGALKESTSSDPGSQSDSLSPFTYNPNFNNGQQLLRIEATAACCPPCAQFDDQIVPSELRSQGIRIPRNDYQEAIGKLMETATMSGFNCCSSEAFFWTLACIIILPILGSFLAIFLMVPLDDSGFSVVTASLYAILAFLQVLLVARCVSRIRVDRAMRRTLVEVNTILAKSHILATVTGRCICYPVAVLHFVYFERGSCLMKLLEDLMARSGSAAVMTGHTQADFTDPSSSSNMDDSPPGSDGASSSCVVPIDVDDAAPLLSEAGGDADFNGGNSSQTSRMSELKAEAEALLLNYSELYVRLLVTKNLPQPRRSRGHTQQGACLCQLVELHQFGWKLDREETSIV